MQRDPWPAAMHDRLREFTPQDDREARLRDVTADQCGATDGFSFCTEPPHPATGTHWDRNTQHEWNDED